MGFISSSYSLKEKNMIGKTSVSKNRLARCGLTNEEYYRISRSIKDKFLLRENLECEYCQCILNHFTLTIDHVIEIKDGGTHTEENIVPCCFECNTLKTRGEFYGFPRKGEYPLLNKKGGFIYWDKAALDKVINICIGIIIAIIMVILYWHRRCN